MRAPRLLLQSPLGRHPALLWRKVAARLFGARLGLSPVPQSLAVAYPAEWNTALRQWLDRLSWQPAPHSYTRVLGHEFKPESLWRWCRDGLPGSAGLERDVKLIWDFSRAHALFTNAAAAPDQVEPGAAFVRQWAAANENTDGLAWTCAMDVALRAVNWVFADVLHRGALGKEVGPDWAGLLWRHGDVTWQRLEARLISSNHYLADLVGLLVVGSAFPNDAQAQKWARFARGEFPRALLAQTHPDGGLNEASLRYHAFVTEMALVFRLAQGAPFPPAAEQRLRAMCQILADLRDSEGDVFPFGDDDSGRVLGADFVTHTPRVDVLLGLAETIFGDKPAPANGALYAHSGWWVQRRSDFVAAVEFGGVGMHGLGAHAHNDDLSFCLEWRGQPVIVDPGTYLYTSDPAARDRFRSTASHNTVMVDGREQRELGRDPFSLPGRTEPWPVERSSAESLVITREVSPAVRHRREFIFRDRGFEIRDVLSGQGSHRLDWFFHFHPSIEVTTTASGLRLRVPKAGDLLLGASCEFEVMQVQSTGFSPGYGHQQPTACWALRGTMKLPIEVCFSFTPAS